LLVTLAFIDSAAYCADVDQASVCGYWVYFAVLLTAGKMAVSKSLFDKTKFEHLPSHPVLTSILNGHEVDSDQGKY